MQTADVPSRIDVARDLLLEIRRGDYGHSGKLPSENDLAARFETTRNTLREALQDLYAAEVIEPRHRFGWFVQADQRRELPFTSLSSHGWHEFCNDQGLNGRERPAEAEPKRTPPPEGALLWEVRSPADGSWLRWALKMPRAGGPGAVKARPGTPSELSALRLGPRSYVLEVDREGDRYVLDVRRFHLVNVGGVQ